MLSATFILVTLQAQMTAYGRCLQYYSGPLSNLNDENAKSMLIDLNSHLKNVSRLRMAKIRLYYYQSHELTGVVFWGFNDLDTVLKELKQYK
jgi:hypothetical protein